MKTSEPILFDTNVLVYNQDQDSIHYKEAAFFHKKTLSQEITAAVSSQNLLEFAAVITNPKKIVRPLSQKLADLEIEKYLKTSFFKIIYPNEKSLSLFTGLFKKYHLGNAKQAFDLFLIAIMLANDVRTILTANYKDFEKFKEIRVVKLYSSKKE